MNVKIEIRDISLSDVANLTKVIPEFPDYDSEYFKKRIGDGERLVIGAFIGNELAGYLIAFNRQNGNSDFPKELIEMDKDCNAFYLDEAAVLPSFRRKGVMQAIHNYTEQWVMNKGFHAFSLTTWNKMFAMRTFLVKNKYMLTNIRMQRHNKKLSEEEFRLDYIKRL